MSYPPAEIETEDGEPAGDLAAAGPALVVRAGGGRAGELFVLTSDPVTIGRSEDADILLDDVTVSRLHAMVRRRPDGLYIEDADSLNGTYVNRRRIESHRLADGDELQVGKFKLTYLER
jgi:pSer/pThr/pTyr-binding forkhead associated (FHA) protein